MAEPLVIYGAGKIAQAVTYYFERDSDYEIVGYACDAAYLPGDTFLGKPVVASEDMAERFPPATHKAFVALGYQDMNRLRAGKVAFCREQGYELVSYVSPSVQGQFTVGSNTIVMDDVVIQPCVTLRDNVFAWGGTMIGHHTEIGDDCWLTGSCAIGGVVEMGRGCFVGLNATVGHEIKVGQECMLGAASLVHRTLPDGTVLVAADTTPHRLNAEQFSRFSSCFRTN